MFFHALKFAGSRRSCLNTRPLVGVMWLFMDLDLCWYVLIRVYNAPQLKSHMRAMHWKCTRNANSHYKYASVSVTVTRHQIAIKLKQSARSMKQMSRSFQNYEYSLCISMRLNSSGQYSWPVPILFDFSLTVKVATLIFISGCGSAISAAKEGKPGFIYNLVES